MKITCLARTRQTLAPLSSWDRVFALDNPLQQPATNSCVAIHAEQPPGLVQVSNFLLNNF